MTENALRDYLPQIAVILVGLGIALICFRRQISGLFNKVPAKDRGVWAEIEIAGGGPVQRVQITTVSGFVHLDQVYPGDINASIVYKLNGKPVSRAEAVAYVKKSAK